MPLPIAPIAGVALRLGMRYGAVALATYAISRAAQERGARDQRAEDAMDDLSEGVHFRREADQVNGGGRFVRTVRVGTSGPGVEIDASALTRIRFRRV